MTKLLLIAIAALVIGLLVGILIGRLGKSSNPSQRRLQQQIDELRNEYTRYQAQVNEHFMESAQMVRRLNDVYRDFNQHTTKGATRLCHDEDWLDELRREDETARLNSMNSSGEPPRDYAPKSSGTLSEDYGLGQRSQN